MPVTTLSVAIACAALAGLIAWSAVLAWRGPDETGAVDSPRRLSGAAAILSAGLAILAVKLWFISQYATSVPFYDAWDGEVAQILARLAAGDLQWSDLLAPHNEHRIAVQRLAGLGLLLGNGQWDARLQMVVNAGVHALAGIVLLAMLWRQFGWKHLGVLSALVLLAWALPFGWENSLSGFQLSFYLFVLFFILALGVMQGAAPGAAAWYLGPALLMLSLFTLGSGVANAVAVGAVLALGWLAEPAARRRIAPGLIACAAVVLLGVVLAVPSHLPPARQFEPFANSLRRWMAWPTQADGALAILPWLPMLALAVVVLRRPLASAPVARTLLGIGGWVALQAVAIAYGRAQATDISSRYMDLLALGFVANGAAILALGARWRGRWMAAAIVLWAAVTVPGLARESEEARLTSIPRLGSWYHNHGENLRRFIATGDIAVLAGRNSPVEIPHPNASLIAGALTVDAMRSYLPPDLQPPLDVQPLPATTPGSFVTPGIDGSTRHDRTRPSRGSFTELGKQAAGRFESAALSCAYDGYLRIDVAGHPGRDGTDLRLVDGRGRTLARPIPGRAGRDGWTPVFVRCPREPFSIVAEDSTSDGWIAFRPPVEYGPLSALAFQLAGAWRSVLAGAAVLALAALGLRTAKRRTRTRASGDRSSTPRA